MAVFASEYGYYKLSNGIVIRLGFGDTSFTESFNLSNFYFPRVYSKSDCIIIIYSITNKESFEKCNFYRDKILEFCKGKNVLLLGNKSDLNDNRKVSFEEAEKFAKSNNYIFSEVSCAKNENIREAMEVAINLGLKDKKIEEENVNLTQEQKKQLLKQKNCLIQ